jgi:hypothetical protein
MKASLFLLGAIGAQACQRERHFVNHRQAYVKRQNENATFPPALDTNEQILLNSFDNTSISEWSYYYSASGTPPDGDCANCLQLMATTSRAAMRLWHNGRLISGQSMASPQG